MVIVKLASNERELAGPRGGEGTLAAALPRGLFIPNQLPSPCKAAAKGQLW